MHAVELPEDRPSLLRLKLSYLNLPLPVLVLSSLLDAVVPLLDEVERLGHVLLVLDELLELSLLLVDAVDGIVSLLDVRLLLLQTEQFRLLVLLVLSCLLLGFA